MSNASMLVSILAICTSRRKQSVCFAGSWTCSVPWHSVLSCMFFSVSRNFVSAASVFLSVCHFFYWGCQHHLRSQVAGPSGSLPQHRCLSCPRRVWISDSYLCTCGRFSSENGCDCERDIRILYAGALYTSHSFNCNAFGLKSFLDEIGRAHV